MTYAISGSSGFIGSVLSEHLVKDGHTVQPIKRYMMGQVESLASFLEATGSEVVVHLAAYGNHFYQNDHKEILRVNTLYTLNVLKAAGTRKLYNFSTSSVLLKIQTLYSISKACGEALVSLFPHAINIRPYSVYGPGEADFRLIPTICRCLRTGERMTLDESATHDWIFVNDLVTAFLNGHTQIGTGEKRTNIELVRKLEEISGKKLNYAQGSVRSYDNSDWVCPAGVEHRSIEEGLLKTYNYYRDQT